MPRPSAAELAVIGPSGIETVRRPEAPEELTDEQALEWRAVVNRMPADWFPRETHSILVQYCRQVRGNHLAQLIDAAQHNPDFDCKTYLKLVRAEESISRTIAALASKMRISQAATARVEYTRKPQALETPWSKKKSA